MKLNRKKYQEIKKMDHAQMDRYLESVRAEGERKARAAYQEALEGVPGIGQIRREGVIQKAEQILKGEEKNDE
ncbi:hypothetical protein C3V36_07135 [Lachnospiraceae bacterium oral taxon 500]|nr:hypothetical protein C3V36_07135 [Lachnospiraceae bacterium oral taxon 500]